MSYTKVQMVEMIKMFLKANKADKKFQKVMNSKNETLEECITYRMGLYGNMFEDWLEGAFVWANTKEGHNYWSEINSEWQKFYKIMCC